MDKQLTPEMIEKAKTAKSAEELISIAKENGITLTEEQANAYYQKLNQKTGTLSDEELDNVSGGCNKTHTPIICPHCGSTNVEYGFSNKAWCICKSCNYEWLYDF